MKPGPFQRNGAIFKFGRFPALRDAFGVGGAYGPRLPPALFWLVWTATAAASIAALSVWAVKSRDTVLATARDDVARVGKQGATYVENIVGLADAVLVRLADSISQADLSTLGSDKVCASLVCADYGRSAKALLIAFAQPNGDLVIAGSNGSPASLADRDYFAALKAEDVGLFIGKPRRNRIVDGTYLPMGRRLAPREQGFHGIVAAAINVDLVHVFFQGLGTGTVDRITLRDRSGDTLVGWPQGTETGIAASECGASDPAAGDILASERLTIGGLSLDVCRSAGNALQAWRRQLFPAIGVTSLLLLAPALAFPALRRRWERRMRQQIGLRGLVVEAFDVQFIVAAKPDGTFMLEALTFNRGAELGGASARLVGRTTRELFPSEDAEAVEAEYRAVLATGKTRRSERRIRLGGMHFVWSTVLVPLGHGHGGYIYGAATDMAGEGALEGGLQRFTENVLRREDNERRRIARELHDTTGQNLIAAGFELGTVAGGLGNASPRVRAALAEARKLVDHSIGELRTLSYVLYPPLLDEAGLGLALATLAEGFGKRAGLSVIVSVAEDVAGRRWAPEVELALYRLAQEALTNVQRHAAAKTARIGLRLGAPGQLELTIEDGDGIRGHPSVPPVVEGAGIRGMRDRLEALGGTLTVEPREGGLLVTAAVPTLAATS